MDRQFKRKTILVNCAYGQTEQLLHLILKRSNGYAEVLLKAEGYMNKDNQLLLLLRMKFKMWQLLAAR